MTVARPIVAADAPPPAPTHRRRRTTLVVLTVGTALAAVLSLGWGAVVVPPSEVVHALMSPDAPAAFVIRSYRLPRVLCGLLVGAALAIAGTMLQRALRNPLASPDVVGVTKGAGLGAVIVIMLVPAAAAWLMPAAVVLGALAAVTLLFAMVGPKRAPAIVALTGIAVGAVFHAAMMFIVVTRPGDVNRAMIWLAGSLYGSTMAQAAALAVTLLVMLPVVVAVSGTLDLAWLADDSVTTLGLDPRRIRLVLVIVSALLAAAAVAVAGTIGFLGLLAPHIASSLAGHRPRYLLPTAALMGALLLTAADLAGRVFAPPSEIPAGIVISVIGVPYLLYLLWRGSRVR